MYGLYNFVTGPLVWASFAIFIFGTIYRLASMYALAKKKDAVSLAYMDWTFSFRSIINWLIPFNALGWKKNPVLTVVTYVFHICLLATPILLSAHIIMVEESWGVSWWNLSDSTADILTILVIASCAFFAGRRLYQKDVRFLTSGQDWLILAIVALPFITGFLAYHQLFNYQVMVIAHVLAGNIMIAAIPFTRLSHMFFAVFTRAYMGSEFGKIRRARDW
jgi:nitrate reductase gamma subunit